MKFAKGIGWLRLTSEGFGKIEVRGWVTRCQVNGFAEFTRGIVELLLFEVQGAKMKVCGREVRLQTKRLGECCDGLGIAFLLGKSRTEIIPKLGTLWCEFDRTAEFRRRFLQILVTERSPQHPMSFSVVRRRLDGGAQLLFRLWSFTLPGENASERNTGTGECRS